MKKIVMFFAHFLLAGTCVFAQVGINTDNSTPDASAGLEVKFPDKGVLLPRITFDQRNAIASPAEGLMVFCTDCLAGGSLCVFSNGDWRAFTECIAPSTSQAANVVSPGQITWNWTAVAGASGYKWNTNTNYSSATDMGTAITKTETGLSCGTIYTRYVWVYNECGSSASTALTQASYGCPVTCGSDLTISHLAAGGVAPVDKTVTYGTVNGIPGEPAKCWITRNLGASQQPTAVNNNTEAPAGWYFQFNHKQGFQYITSRIPATTWISAIGGSSDWTTANDPCSIELGLGWRIPTLTEWTNVDASGNWTNWNGPFSSTLKLHAAGNLSYHDGTLAQRGSNGNYWSSTQDASAEGKYLGFDQTSSALTHAKKAFAYSLRCIRDN